MTFEERMAELGVDLSDLPTEYSEPHLWKAYDALFDWNDHCELLAPFVLHLIDVIDRMETRLVNVTGERDWLKDVVTTLNLCETCGAPEDGCDSCPDWPQYEYSGVPEDWRPNDV